MNDKRYRLNLDMDEETNTLLEETSKLYGMTKNAFAKMIITNSVEGYNTTIKFLKKQSPIQIAEMFNMSEEDVVAFLKFAKNIKEDNERKE